MEYCVFFAEQNFHTAKLFIRKSTYLCLFDGKLPNEHNRHTTRPIVDVISGIFVFFLLFTVYFSSECVCVCVYVSDGGLCVFFIFCFGYYGILSVFCILNFVLSLFLFVFGFYVGCD